MIFDRMFHTRSAAAKTNRRTIRTPLAGLLASATLVAGIWSGAAVADPAEDALAKLSELSRQAEQLTEATHAAQLDPG